MENFLRYKRKYIASSKGHCEDLRKKQRSNKRKMADVKVSKHNFYKEIHNFLLVQKRRIMYTDTVVRMQKKTGVFRKGGVSCQR